MPLLYYIRHGETDWNEVGRFQGHRDVPLNDRGRAQAGEAGAILLALMTRDGRHPSEFGFVASPLGRARATMDLLRASLGLSPAGYLLDARLREIGYGDWEGLTVSEMRSRDPDVFAARELDRWSRKAPSGEAYAEVTVRVRAWFEALDRDTVAVAHGGTMRALTVVLGLATPEEAVDAPVLQGAVYRFADGTMERYA
jgi:probable phosphoglycerate mutase